MPLTNKGSIVLRRQGGYKLVLDYFVFQLGEVGFVGLDLHFCLQ